MPVDTTLSEDAITFVPLGKSLSVVVVSYGTREVLRQCLESIRRNGTANQETIVVDNHSPDGSAAMVQTDFPEVRLIRNSDNLGFSKASNQGIREARGKYVLLLNSDTIVLPGAFQAMADFLDAHPEAGGCGCRLLFADGSIQASVDRHATAGLTRLFFRLLGCSHWIRGDRPRRLVRQYLDPLLGTSLRSCLDPYVTHTCPLEVDAISGACLMLRREAVHTVGLLDEQFFMYVEDLDYCIRLRKAGWRLYYLPTIQIIHLAEQSSGGRMRRYSLHPYQSLFYFYRKHYSYRTLLAARLLVLVVFCARWIWNLIPGVFRAHSVSRQTRSDIAEVISLCYRYGASEQ